VNVRVSPRSHYDLAWKTHSRNHEPEFPLARSRLVQVHEVHVNGGPRELFVELRVQMEKRFCKRTQATDPHAGRRERVHPHNQTKAIPRTVGIQAQPLYGLAAGHNRFDNDLYGNKRRSRESGSDDRGVFLNCFQRFFSIEMLAARNKPKLHARKINHPLASTSTIDAEYLTRAAMAGLINDTVTPANALVSPGALRLI
jgi:hypothetical protein